MFEDDCIVIDTISKCIRAATLNRNICITLSAQEWDVLGVPTVVKSKIITVQADTPYTIGYAPLCFYVCRHTGSQTLSCLGVANYAGVTLLNPTSGGVTAQSVNGAIQITSPDAGNLILVTAGR